MAAVDAGSLVTSGEPVLDRLVDAVRSNPAMGHKADIAMVREVLGATDWLGGPGDDGAVVEVGGQRMIVCGEAIFPPFVERDPYGAGVAAVLANINDVAAMGAVPLAIVDTLTGDDAHCRAALEGMRYAAELYKVPIVGGHLTVVSGPPALSAFALGVCEAPLSVTAVRPGQRLVLLACLEGQMRADFPFFRSFDERGPELAGDVRLLARLAADGTCEAAKDVSMAGLIGSLAMLLEPSSCGVTIDVGDLPCPVGVDLERWLVAFPCYAFLLCVSEGQLGACRAAASGRGLTCAELGTLDASGRVRLRDAGRTVTVIDLTTEEVTGLRSRA